MRLPRTAAVLFVLVLFAITGLGAGVAARSALGSAVPRASTQTPGTVIGIATTPATTFTTSTTSTTVPATTATTTPANALVVASGFTIAAVASQKTVAPGQTVTIVVSATARDGVTPVVGLECFMRAPPSGTPLYSQWPASRITAKDGTATWTLTAPQLPPGQYAFEIVAYGAQDWSYRWEVTLTLVSAAG